MERPRRTVKSRRNRWRTAAASNFPLRQCETEPSDHCAVPVELNSSSCSDLVSVTTPSHAHHSLRKGATVTARLCGAKPLRSPCRRVTDSPSVTVVKHSRLPTPCEASRGAFTRFPLGNVPLVARRAPGVAKRSAISNDLRTKVFYTTPCHDGDVTCHHVTCQTHLCHLFAFPQSSKKSYRRRGSNPYSEALSATSGL